MKQLTLFQEQFMRTAELFLWAEALDFTQWFKGDRVRWKRTEYTLPRLVKHGYLKTCRYGRSLVYTTSNRASSQHIAHGLACTKALLRFKESKEGLYISESFFRRHGYKAIPEWAIVYPNGTLLFEYLTADNFRREKHVKQKIAVYKQELNRFEAVFHNPFYVFVAEANCEEVKLLSRKTNEHFYLTDADRFYSVSQSEQLSTRIYIWGMDGKEYPLSRND
jgi:hypothetical protein